jgi:hypothetical protein
MRRAAAEIAPESIERIAQRVAQLLHHDRPAPIASTHLVDANQLASHLGLTRAWVYEHAHELGAIRVGSGPRARLRFDLAAATAALTAPEPRSRQADRQSPATNRPQRHTRPNPRPDLPLLPVHEPRMRGVSPRPVSTSMRRIVRAMCVVEEPRSE